MSPPLIVNYEYEYESIRTTSTSSTCTCTSVDDDGTGTRIESSEFGFQQQQELLYHYNSFPSIQFLSKVLIEENNNHNQILFPISSIGKRADTYTDTDTNNDRLQQELQLQKEIDIQCRYYQYLVRKSLLEKYNLFVPFDDDTILYDNDKEEKIETGVDVKDDFKNINNSNDKTNEHLDNRKCNKMFRLPTVMEMSNVNCQWNALCQQIITTESNLSNTATATATATNTKIKMIPLELIELIQSNCTVSNKRNLFWSTLYCQPACQFQLHAHPNIEIILCLYGELHELRIISSISSSQQQQQQITTPIVTTTFEPILPVSQNHNDEIDIDNNNNNTNHSNPIVAGPDLSNVHNLTWKFSTLQQHSCLINELGSIHKSFTSTTGAGCIILCLWSGSHANITNEPSSSSSSINITQTIQNIDTKITNTRLQIQQQMNNSKTNDTCCSGYDWESIAETFLPASERRSNS